MTPDHEALLQAFVDACLVAFGEERVEAVVAHGSAVKGGAIPGFSDADFQVYLTSDCFDGDGVIRDELAFATQARIGPLPWSEYGFGYPQAFFLDARRLPAWREGMGPIPGTYRVLRGRLPETLGTPDAAFLRESAARYLKDLPRLIASDVSNFADSGDEQLPRRVRLLGTTVTPTLFHLLSLDAADAVEVWSLTKQEALERVEQRFPAAEGPRAARRFYGNVVQLYGGRFDPDLGRETFRLGVRFLRWAAEVGRILPGPA